MQGDSLDFVLLAWLPAERVRQSPADGAARSAISEHDLNPPAAFGEKKETTAAISVLHSVAQMRVSTATRLSC